MKTKTLTNRKCMAAGILTAVGILFAALLGAVPFVLPREEAVTETSVYGEDVSPLEFTFPLRAGTYALELSYEAEDYAVLQVLLQESDGTPVGESGTNVIILPFNRMHQRLRVFVPRNGLSARILCSDATEDTELVLHGLSLDYLRKDSALYGALRTGGGAILIALLAAGLFYLRRKKDPELSRTVLFLSAVFLLSCRPLALGYIPGGHDITFHLSRIGGIAQGLRDGAFPVRMQSGWWNGYGYPVGIFYGDLLLYVPAVLHLLGMPLFRAYQLFVFFINAGTAALSFYCFRRMTGSVRAGLFSTGVYCLSMWRLTDIYIRAAVGEYCAIMFFPLVMLGFFELFAKTEDGIPETGSAPSGVEEPSAADGTAAADRKRDRRAAVHLALGYTGLILTHLLSTLMAAAFSILLCVIHAKQLLRDRKIVPLAKGAALSALLSGFFLVPVLDYMRRHDLVIMHLSGLIQTHGARFGQLFGLTFDTMAASNVLENTEPEMPLTAGLSVALILVCAAVYILSGKGKKLRAEKELLLLTLLSLLMSTHVFPYDMIQEKLPLLFRLIGSVEFPWRYLAVATAVSSLLGGLILAQILRDASRGTERVAASGTEEASESDAAAAAKPGRAAERAALAAACGIILVGAVQGSLLMEQRIRECYLHMRPADAAALEADSRDSMYLFQGQDWSEMDDRQVRTSGDAVRVTDEMRRGTDYTVSVETGGAETPYVEFPVFSYYGYAAYLQGGTALPVETGDGNRARVSLPAGYTGNVTLSFRTPLYWRAADIISLCTLLILIGSLIKTGREQVS